MKTTIAATAPLEIAHKGLDGVLHGHSLSVEAWTERPLDLDEWRARIAAGIAHIGRGTLEETIGGRTFEEVGAAGTGLVAHLTPAQARRLRLALRSALKELGQDLGQ